MITFLRAALIGVVLFILGMAMALALYVHSGSYDIAADSPHEPWTLRLIETARDRSIARYSAAIHVPPLNDAAAIAQGAEHYAEMCTGCHLAPGAPETEIRPGLYPKPPKLAEVAALPAAQQFWIIKHGIKLTAMPAWGTTHDDATIWAMVAFIQKLPGMTPEQYAQITGSSGGADQDGHVADAPPAADTETPHPHEHHHHDH